MDNLFFSVTLFAIAVSIWLMPNVYPIVATVLLTIIAAIYGDIDISSVIVLVILSITGYQYLSQSGDKNPLLKINLLLLALWALWSEDYQGRVLSWSSSLQMASFSQEIILTLNFEKILTALLLAAYILKPEKSLAYWQLSLSRGWEMLLLVYVMLLIPLIAILHFFAGLSIGGNSLITLLMNLFLICFTEEVLFRLVLQNWVHELLLKKFKRLAPWLAIALVSSFYGFFHIRYGYFIIIFAVFVGTAYGYVYQKSGKIEVAILVHFALRLTLGLVLAFFGQGLYLPITIN